MADTPQAPAAEIPNTMDDGSLTSATNAFLGLMESQDQPQEQQEAQDPEVEESTQEAEDESTEAVSEDDSEQEIEQEESDSEDLSENEEEPDFDTTYTLKVDGEEVEVTLDELLKGYSRNSSYTKKSQALSEDRKQIEALQSQYNQEIAQITAEREQYARNLQSVIENSNLDKFANIDWERLRAEDPIEFLQKREEVREAQEKIARTQQEQQSVLAKNNEEAQKQWQQTVTSEHAKLVEKLPDWGDADKQKILANELRSYASTVGFQEEEINSLIDHRSFIVLNKARLYDEMQKANPKAKKLANKPKVIRKSKSTDKQSQNKSKRKASMNRLKQTGRAEDAASLFEDYVEL